MNGRKARLSFTPTFRSRCPPLGGPSFFGAETAAHVLNARGLGQVAPARKIFPKTIHLMALRCRSGRRPPHHLQTIREPEWMSALHREADIRVTHLMVCFGPLSDSCTAAKTHHSITSSAVICIVNGTARPSAFAVLRLMRYWNFSVREIWIRPIRSPRAYATALHEIGHILGRYQMRFSGMVSERWAWQWARRNALQWTPAMEQHAERCLKSYE